jgi:hypothetical protein
MPYPSRPLSSRALLLSGISATVDLALSVQSGAECIMAYTPSSPDNIRLTITVTPEVHATFSRFAKASGMSLGRAMGEWLSDTLEGAELLASQLERARASPKAVIREMHAFALGLSDETGDLMQKVSEEGRRARVAAQAVPGSADPRPPRLVIRGGKSPSKTLGKRS